MIILMKRSVSLWFMTHLLVAAIIALRFADVKGDRNAVAAT